MRCTGTQQREAELCVKWDCEIRVLGAAEIQAYLLHLIRERKLAYASVNQAACAFRFLHRHVLDRREVSWTSRWPRCPNACRRSSRAKTMDATTVRFRVRATPGKRVLRVPAEEFLQHVGRSKGSISALLCVSRSTRVAPVTCL